MKSHFEVMSRLGKLIQVSQDRWELIVTKKHTSIAGREREVRLALIEPEQVRRSKSDPDVYLYYRAFGGRHLCVVAKHHNGDGFIVTAYFTKRVKVGERIWPK